LFRARLKALGLVLAIGFLLMVSLALSAAVTVVGTLWAGLLPGKALLLRDVPEIPAWVAGRPKRGFLFPMAEWLDGAWAQEFAPVDRLPAVKMETWYRKWAVLVFERWSRQLKVTHE